MFLEGHESLGHWASLSRFHSAFEEEEWRNQLGVEGSRGHLLGFQMSLDASLVLKNRAGWIHYEYHKPEMHVLPASCAIDTIAFPI